MTLADSTHDPKPPPNPNDRDFSNQPADSGARPSVTSYPVLGQPFIYREPFPFVGNGSSRCLTPSALTGGAAGNGACNAPSVSDNGTIAAIVSSATDLVAGGTTGTQLFVFKTFIGQNLLASRNTAGIAANLNINGGFVSGDGSIMGFLSQATNLDGAGPFTLNQPFLVLTP